MNRTGNGTTASDPTFTRNKRAPWAQRPLIALLATGFGSGMLRPFPGSWGSIPPVFLAWGLAGQGNPWLFSVSTLAMITLAIAVSDAAEELFGHDSRRIVIDEFAGVFVSFLGLPTHWHVMIPVFVFFRFFDVVKPWPARRLELLPGGWGVTADDVAAGIYANLATRLVARLWPAWFLA